MLETLATNTPDDISFLRKASDYTPDVISNHLTALLGKFKSPKDIKDTLRGMATDFVVDFCVVSTRQIIELEGVLKKYKGVYMEVIATGENQAMLAGEKARQTAVFVNKWYIINAQLNIYGDEATNDNSFKNRLIAMLPLPLDEDEYSSWVADKINNGHSVIRFRSENEEEISKFYEEAQCIL